MAIRAGWRAWQIGLAAATVAAGVLVLVPWTSGARTDRALSAPVAATRPAVAAVGTQALPESPNRSDDAAARDKVSPPPGLSAAQWEALIAELSRRPGGDAELNRMRAYLVWSDRVKRWQRSPDDAGLAAEIFDGLPGRLAQREVSVPEARQLAGALLSVLQPDPVQRAAALKAFDQRLPARSAPDAREVAFQQAQAAAVAAWQATAPSARDPAVLQARIEQLRLQSFAAGRSPTSLQENSR